MSLSCFPNRSFRVSKNLGSLLSAPGKGTFRLPKTPAQLFGERLVAAMGSMTPSELARRAGLNRQQVHRYLAGSALPRADSFMRLCGVLALDPWAAVRDDTHTAQPRLERFDADMFGNARNPGPDQVPSGVYELLSANPLMMDTVTRLTLSITNDGASCRVRAVLPRAALPSGSPYAFRRMTGILKVKFEHSYYLTLQNRASSPDEEKLFVTVILGPEDPAQRIRRGIATRIVPYPGASSMASKVVLRRLDAGSYRSARRRPPLLKMQDAPDFVRDYFLAVSQYPYHFGPAADAVEAADSAAASHIHATTARNGLEAAVGGATCPTEDDLKSGVYDLFAALDIETPRLLRIPLLIAGDARAGRWAYSRMPNGFFDVSVPKAVRELSGPVLIKRDSLLHIFGVIRSPDGLGGLSHYYRFGAADFRTGMRLGFVNFPDLGAQAPLVGRAVLIRSSEQNYPRAFRQTAAFGIDEAPSVVRSYFLKSEPAPYALSTITHPKLF